MPDQRRRWGTTTSRATRWDTRKSGSDTSLGRWPRGPRPDGTVYFPGPWVGAPAAYDFTLEFLRYFVYGDPTYDLQSFDLEADLSTLDGVLRPILNADDADLPRLSARGGKLLVTHGWHDPALNSLTTVDYHSQVADVVGGDEIDHFFRLFMASGMSHCSGGPGPNRLDALTAMERWLRDGTAPDQIVASNPATGRTRPLCPYPQVATYTRSGSINDASSYRCEPRKSGTARCPRGSTGGCHDAAIRPTPCTPSVEGPCRRPTATNPSRAQHDHPGSTPRRNHRLPRRRRLCRDDHDLGVSAGGRVTRCPGPSLPDESGPGRARRGSPRSSSHRRVASTDHSRRTRTNPEAAILGIWSAFEGPLFIAATELWVAARLDADLRNRLRPIEREIGHLIHQLATECSLRRS